MSIGGKIAYFVVICCVMPFMAKAVKVSRQEGPVASLTGTNRNDQASKNITSEGLLKNLSDTDIFLQVGTEDRLTWGMLHTYIDAALGTKLKALLSAAASLVEQLVQRNRLIDLCGTHTTTILYHKILTYQTKQYIIIIDTCMELHKLEAKCSCEKIHLKSKCVIVNASPAGL